MPPGAMRRPGAPARHVMALVGAAASDHDIWNGADNARPPHAGSGQRPGRPASDESALHRSRVGRLFDWTGVFRPTERSTSSPGLRHRDGRGGPTMSRPGPWPLRYGVPVLAVAGTAAVLLTPQFNKGAASVPFFAVLFSAWYGGLGPGIFGTALI